MKKITMPWHSVFGFGAHIKASSTTLSIRQKSDFREIPLEKVEHLLLVGGHNLHTSAVSNLLKQKSSISFFDADATPLGILSPYGDDSSEYMENFQRKTPVYHAASELVRSSVKSRMNLIDEVMKEAGRVLFYEGEYELFLKSLEDVDYLVKIDELRRLQRLISDMYYEVVSRGINPIHGFRRRTKRPHNDPVNAMLSIGYAMLFGNVSVSVAGSHLNPDYGVLSEGGGSLIYDLMAPLRAGMVDSAVFRVAREYLTPDHYDLSTKRCHLRDDLMAVLSECLHKSIDQKRIDMMVSSYADHLMKKTPLRIYY
ncbi:CRISPR-associated endonuclease Cas1 [Methanoplanus endosymbiosus]|uniref:CRISPR-associated endonuclease Cas1 n=1 Tax=Methanoplanus endosymbiosus TaxID=33865 RepID=A0A9E7PNU4_9EURY|nr:CRISPR-associated endonuclease Cas1 [Methanoplanus endosymbiosus]UUX93695.1 CRISPR-associated endonuclease Cas1 [Methanoplanus endosymbiosus]